MLGIATVLSIGALTIATLPADVQRRLYSNYPSWAVREGRSAGTVIEAIVEADGKVRECRVLAFVGNERLAIEECTGLLRHKLKPARDQAGRPILSVYRNSMRRHLDQRNSDPEAYAVKNWKFPPNLTLKDSSLSGGASPVDVDVILYVEQDGSASACEARPRSSSEAAAFVPRVCADLATRKMPGVSGADGTPAPYVTNLTVRLEAGTPDKT